MTVRKLIDAVVLCGGLGTRLRSVVGDKVPKCLASVDGKPFLWYVLDWCHRWFVDRTILCTGHGADQVEAVFGPTFAGLPLVYSREAELLGTGGAVRNALPHVGTDPFLVLNGDTYCRFDLDAFVAKFNAAKDSVDGLVGTGLCLTDGRQKSAGVYLLTRRYVEALPPDGKVDLEDEEALAGKGVQLGTHGLGVPFLDVGTPAGYARAADVLARRAP